MKRTIALLAAALLLVQNMPLLAQEDEIAAVEQGLPEAAAEPRETAESGLQTEDAPQPETAAEIEQPEDDTRETRDLILDEDAYFQSTIDQYADYDYADPQYIKDTAFFGVWGGTGWTTKPLLDYGRFPELEAVREAAAAGDYELAKYHLLDYYRAKFKTHNRTLTPVTNKRTTLSAQLVFENMIYGGAVEKLLLREEADWVQADILTDVKAVLGEDAVSRRRGFLLQALKKDGYEAVFNSKEAAENRPYVEVTVNGNVRRYEPIADATVCGGGNAKKNYGASKELLAEESQSTIGKAKVVDSYTKIANLLFDFDDLKPGDEVTDATLYLYGRMRETGNPQKPTVKMTGKHVILFVSSDLGWEESKVNWNNQTHSVYSFDGESGPNLNDQPSAYPSWQDNITKWYYATNLAQRYLYKREEVYAYHAIRVMVNTIRRLGSNQSQQDKGGNLNMGVRAQKIPEMLNMLIDSEYMTPEIFTMMMKNVYMLGSQLITKWNKQSEMNNWGVSESAGLFNLSVNFPEFSVVHEPLRNDSGIYQNGKNGGWRAVANYRLSYKAKKDLFSDGSSIEIGLGYADYTYNLLASAITYANEVGLGTDVFSQETLGLVDKYALFLMNAGTPQYGDWQQGHGYGFATDFKRKWDKTAYFTKNPQLLWAITDGAEGEKPNFTSIVYDVRKSAVLRSDWDPDAVAIQINADGGIESHGQHDDLTLNMAAYGQYLLVDPQYFNYEYSQPYTAWLTSTRAHNTIEINNRSQNGPYQAGKKGPDGEALNSPKGSVKGNLHKENRELNEIYNFLRAETKNYPGFQEFRDVLFVKPGYFIVSDYIKPSAAGSNQYRQGWHFLPTAGLELDPETNVAKTNFDGANLIIAPVNGEVKAKGALPGGWYSPKASTAVRAAYLTYTKNTAGTATFHTVLYPTKAGQHAAVETQPLPLNVPESAAGAFTFDVTDENTGKQTHTTYYTLFDMAQKAQRGVGDFTTDGKLVLAERSQETYTTALVRSATNLADRNNGIYLMKSEQEVEDLGIRWDGGAVALESTKTADLDLKQLTVYADKAVAQVTFNGEEIPFRQKGRYLYFGDTPIIDDGTEIPEEQPVLPQETPKGDNVHGSTSGGGSSGGGGAGGTSSEPVQPPVTPGPTATQEPEQTPAPSQTPGQNLGEAMERELAGHWAEREIREMMDKGIVRGVSADSLGLDRPATRAEFTAMLVRVLEMEEAPYDGSFSDVSAEDWYAGALTAAKQAGLLQGSGGAAQPDRPITREEMAKMLAEVCGRKNLQAQGPVKPFSDQAQISAWALESVEETGRLGLMNGMENGTFQPQAQALREQVIAVLCRLMHLLEANGG